MIWLKRISWLLLAAFVGLFALQWAASETTGEVVVLNTSTTDEGAGSDTETRLWVVDSGGEAWLRAGTENAGWYEALKANPHVTVTRNGETNRYMAAAVPEATDTINGLMRAKYNWGEQLLSKLLDRSSAVAVRLEPAR